MNAPSLRPYQSTAVAGVRQAYAAGKRSPLLVLPTGGGKTTIFSYVTTSAAAKNKCVYLIAHRAELVKQIAMTLARFGTRHRIIAPGPIVRQAQVEQFKAYGRTFVDSQARVFVASVQTLVKRLEDYPAPDLIVVDECFPAGTQIDGASIESLKIGDMVRSVNHKTGIIERKRITRLFKSRPKAMCTVYFDDGSELTCTAGHPFFVPFHGYFNAESLQPGMPVFKLQAVRHADQNRDALPEGSDENSRLGLLWPGVLGQVPGSHIVGHDGENEQAVRIRQDESTQPDAHDRGAAENARDIDCDGPQASCAWREWQGHDGHAGGDAFQASAGFPRCSCGACGCCQAGAGNGIPDALQDRRGHTFNDDCHRGGRVQSLLDGEAGSGPQEGRVTAVVRVARVQIHEPTSSGEFGGVLPDGFVYNIEVEGNHNYFAGDVLVHNCHHLTTDSTWGRVVSAYPDAKLLPVTATPCRLDGKGLGLGQGGFADELVMGPTMRELIEAGFLSPYRIFAPPNALDLTGVRTRAGDYAKEQLASAVDKPSITGDSVAHYQRLTPGKRAVAFCVSVAHAQHVAAEFKGAGVPAEFLDGTLDALERDRIIKRFESGETLVLSSCDIISEGFDLPAIEVAILLRPTQSLSLYIQQVGRALRTFPGKTEAVILDHVGAVATHGLPDEEREWSLDGVKPKRRAANDNEDPDVKITTCGQCFTIHAPAPVCPTCGHVYPPKERKVEQQDGELQELTADAMEALRRQKRAMQGSAQSVEALVAQGISRFRAMKIIEAREAKQAMVGQIMDAVHAHQQETGEGAHAWLGVTLGDIRRAKPKELRALADRCGLSVSAA